MNNNNKVHSKGTVLPFSWESKPGVSKDVDNQSRRGGDHHLDSADPPIMKLPPPPCPPEKFKAALFRDRDPEFQQIPPPPCAYFQKPLMRRSGSCSSFLRRSIRKNDDPFLIAFKECTKRGAGDDHIKWSGVMNRRSDHGGGFGIRKNLTLLSCKHSSNAIDDSVVRASQLPTIQSKRKS